MGAIFSPSAPSVPPPPPVPTFEDPAIEEARKKRRLAELTRRGRAATVLTGGTGDPSTARTDRPGLHKLLGG